MVTLLVCLVTSSSIAAAVDDLVTDFIGVQPDDDTLELDEEHFSSIDIDIDSNINPIVCLFVCFGCGTPESPLPLNPGQGSDSPGEIVATRSISVRGRRSHVPYPRWPVQKRHVQSRGSVAPMILPPRA